jgi:transposase-like protein
MWLDGYAATHRAIRELKSTGRMCRRVRVRSCKYLNNIVGQDHRRLEQRIGPMPGFKQHNCVIRGVYKPANCA